MSRTKQRPGGPEPGNSGQESGVSIRESPTSNQESVGTEREVRVWHARETTSHS